MKAIFVHQGIEFRLECPSSALPQGAAFECLFVAKNLSTGPMVLAESLLALVHTQQSKAGSQDTILAQANLALPWNLAAGSEQRYQWQGRLDENCPVSEKGSVIAFRFGPSVVSNQRLPLTVEPHPYVATVSRLLESSHQFSLKGVKTNSKGLTESKYKPGSVARYSMVDELLLTTECRPEEVTLRWKFKVKKFTATSSASVTVAKGATELEQQLLRSELLDRDGNIKEGPLNSCIEAALSEVTTGF